MEWDENEMRDGEGRGRVEPRAAAMPAAHKNRKGTTCKIGKVSTLLCYGSRHTISGRHQSQTLLIYYVAFYLLF